MNPANGLAPKVMDERLYGGSSSILKHLQVYQYVDQGDEDLSLSLSLVFGPET